MRTVTEFSEEIGKLKLTVAACKRDLAEAEEALRRAYLNGKAILDDYVAVALSREAPLVKRYRQAYATGELIKDQMMLGGRWPRDAKGSRYAEMLESVPHSQRSPELCECLNAWQDFERCLAELNAKHPAPEGYFWNGLQLGQK